MEAGLFAASALSLEDVKFVGADLCVTRLTKAQLFVEATRFFDTQRKLARLSPPSRVSYTPRPRSSFRKATRCPGTAIVGSDRSTNSLTRAVTRSCLGVSTKSAANGALDPEHQLRLEIGALTSSSRTCLRPCGRGPNSWTQHRKHLSGTSFGQRSSPLHWPGSQSLRRCRQASSPPFWAAPSLGSKCSFPVSTISGSYGRDLASQHQSPL